jgi:L-lactate dehydrogenase (cytochrome)
MNPTPDVPAARQLPRWRDIEPMVRGRHPSGPRLHRRLARAHSVADLRDLGRRRVPRAVFDYVDGGAEEEVSLREARDALRRVRFTPTVLRDVSAVSPQTSILGRSAALPLILAPTGLTRAVHHAGEIGVARAAAAAGVPYTLSTMSTTSIEAVAAAAPSGDRWFQLYVWRDRAASQDLLDRAAAAGFTTLVLTVDVPVPGARHRDQRNGFTVPPSLTTRTFWDMCLHPSWWFNLLTTGPLTFASMSSSPSSIAGLIEEMFDPAVTFDDLAWLRARWAGPIVVKGVLDADDAARVVATGADGVVLSNHGGRQLDRATTPLAVLRSVRDRLQDSAALFVDGGIQSGADVAAAVGLGADACLVGRAYLYGLMAGGGPGVSRALELIQADYLRTLRLLGLTSTAQLRNNPAVTLRGTP